MPMPAGALPFCLELSEQRLCVRRTIDKALYRIGVLMTAFRFPAETVDFLTDLRAHNDKAWFEANRGRYESGFVEPAKEFVEVIGPKLVKLIPGIRAEPSVRGSIFRINRDIRFSSDKRPYKDHLDFWFWEGDRKAAVSGLFLRVWPDGVVVGAGAHGFDKHRLATYRDAVADSTTGDELAAIVSRLEATGHEVGGETYQRVPRGYTADGIGERLLRHSALYAHAEMPAKTATSVRFIDTVLGYWRAFVGVHRWLVANVQR
jgi:uncharacterized protein (TIGR02453 family)